MRLVIVKRFCKLCGLCTSFCPKGLLEIVNHQLIMKESSKCTQCGLCSYYCPDFSIYEKDGELAENEQYLN